jgi:predicted alpha/beta hydrolase
MQAASDIFLGWDSPVGVDGVRRDYYFRQLRDWKGSAEVEAMEPEALQVYTRMCAHTLARAHARSGDRIAIASYLGAGDRFDTAIAEFAERYADQNERDHAALLAAEASGRVVTQRGV